MIRGKQVTLRPVETADLPLLQEMANDPDLRALVVGFNWLLPLHGQEAWLAKAQADPTTQRLMVCDDEGRALGMTGLWDLDWHNRNASTGLKLASASARGRGVGTDAIKALMAYAFYEVGLHRLHTQILPFNGASYAAYCSKCHWQVEGRAREHTFRDGRMHDLLQIGALRSDFDSLPDAKDYRRLVFSGNSAIDVNPPG